MKRCAFVARGRVQGVGFRHFTAMAARAHGVAGWVRNEADGSVRGEVEGEDAAVQAFLAEVRAGPRFARVDEVATRDLAVQGDSVFNVR